MIMPFEIHLLISRCWFQKFCSFTPGKMMQFDYVAFFRIGWFSHQPDMFFSIGIVNEIPPFLESESWFGLITFWRKTMHEDMIQEACLYKGQWCYGQQPHQHSAIFTNFWFYHWSSTGPSIYLQIMKMFCFGAMKIWWPSGERMHLLFGTIFWHSRDLVLGSKSMSWVLSGKLRSKQYSKPGLVVLIKNFTTLMYGD